MNRTATIVLTPLSNLYSLGTRMRSGLYRSKIFRTHEIAAPVISVGNITTGGTGKSQLVAWIAKQLAKQQRVCILTRGYGRANPAQRVIVSDGNQILASVNESGDEPLMLAEHLNGKAAVVCDADRVAAANWAIENLSSDVFILDDGFQNLRTARDLNIVTIDATNPWGNRKLIPTGILREPIDGLSRADCIIVTRAHGSVDALIKEIKGLSDAPLLPSHTVIAGIRLINSASSSVAPDLAASVAAFCAIGNPDAFFTTLREANYQLSETIVFRDHHKYTQADVDSIVRRARNRGAQALLTTAKDEVKLRSLRFDIPCHVVDVAIEIDDKEKLMALLEATIKEKSRDIR